MSTPPFVEIPESVTVERWPVRGTERAVMHAGVVGASEWVVLVPGFTGSKEDFIAVVPLLAAAGVGAVAFDQLGQNESDGSPRLDDYALDRMASDVAEIVDVAGGRLGARSAPHLLGHSFGGLVAQEAIAGGHLRPASFVALCTGPGGLPEERWESLPDLVSALEHQALADIWRIMREMDAAEDPATPPADVAAFLSSRWHRNSPVQLQAFGRQLMEQPDLRARMRPAVEGGLPMWVVWGEHDDAWPVDVQAQWAADLGVPTVEIPGVGHSPNAEAPAAMVEALLRVWRA